MDNIDEAAVDELLCELAGIDTHDVNLRHHDKAWAAVEKFVAHHTASAKADAQARGGEAVAWVNLLPGWDDESRRIFTDVKAAASYHEHCYDLTPVYLATQPAPALAREPLSDEQIQDAWADASDPNSAEMSIFDFARSIERHFGITADSARAAASEPPEAWRDVQSERQRQISAEGWTPEHDDEHKEGEMCFAAAGYACAASDALQAIEHQFDGDGQPTLNEPAPLPHRAPWPHGWVFKRAPVRRQLVKAGALILAEIERIDRLLARGPICSDCGAQASPSQTGSAVDAFWSGTLSGRNKPA